MTKFIYGIIGHPVKHSLSPAMQNAAFKAIGADAEYRAYDVAPGELEAFLKDVPHAGISGLNITIPHKIKAKEYVEKYGTLDENAKRLGAVNTIKAAGENVFGFNTDGPGFYRSLVGDLKFEPEGKNILVLGAGGAATALVMYLGNGPAKIFVTDIDETKSAGLKNHYEKYYDADKLIIVGKDDVRKAIKDAALLVNATPIGMKESDGLPIDKNLLRPGFYVYDLVYNRPATELVKEAVRRKAHAVTGIGMLLCQGAISFEIWTGVPAPVEVMRKALKEAIKKL